MPLVQHLFLLTSHNPQFPFPFPGRQTSIRLSSASNCLFSFTPPPHPRTFRFSHSVQYSSLSTTSFTSISSQIANVNPARPSGAFHHVPRPTEQTLGSTQPIFVVRIFVADPRIDVGPLGNPDILHVPHHFSTAPGDCFSTQTFMELSELYYVLHVEATSFHVIIPSKRLAHGPIVVTARRADIPDFS